MNIFEENELNLRMIELIQTVIKATPDGAARYCKIIGDTPERLERMKGQLELENEFGFPFNKDSHHTWLAVGRPYCDHMKLGYFGKDTGRSISWSDDGSQPCENSNEWLLVIKFPTGAFIFGDHYPVETFRAFFTELKAFSPKYCDSNNHALYFSSENAAKVVEAFYDIKASYSEQSRLEMVEKKRRDLQKQLDDLA